MSNRTLIRLALLLSLATASRTLAGTATWSAGAGANTNWSNGTNWLGGAGTGGVPASTDNAVFTNTGAASSFGVIDNAVDGTSGNFGGTIASLQYANTNANFHNTLLAPGVTLLINGADANGNVFVVSTEAASPGAVATASISGPGAALSINSSAANFIVSQNNTTASGTKATLNLSNLDTFTATVNRLGVGVPGKYNWFNNNGASFGNGVVYLARTNVITTAFSGGSGAGNPTAGYTSFANVYVAGHEIEEAIEVGNGADNSASGVSSFVFLGQTNAFFIDSIGVGKSKSSAAAASMLFNPVFSSPSAYFRGTNGTGSRVSFWAIGDNATGGSTSNGALGTNDFSGGTLDAMVDQMFLGIDKLGQTSASNPARGIFTFTSGTINVNNVTLGAQESTSAGNLGPAVGIMNVNGAGATLIVNTNLELGHTTITAGSGLTSSGTLNISGGTVDANNIIVGASSTNNVITMNNGTLVLSNTVASPAKGLTTLNMTNSTLAVSVNGSLTNVVVTNLTTGGATNIINLSSVPVFGSYPTQVALIRYYSGAIGGGGYNFGFGANPLPVSAPNAFLSNNIAKGSVDLVLPTDPRPFIPPTQPADFSGSPGDTVTFAVTPSGVTPLNYQWVYNVTNILVNGPTGNGSTISGSATNTLVLNNAQPADNGTYALILTNAFGSVTSRLAVLTISSSDQAPTISGPTNLTVIAGNNAMFTASVAGSPAPTVQWQKGGADITGATNTTLIITNAQFPADQDTYSIIASNRAGLATNSATLTVIVTPAITTQPSNQVVIAGQNATFTAAASGVPTPGYQWNKNNVPISGANSATFTINGAQASDIATYTITATNAAGSAVSSNATLTVNSATLAIVNLSPANGATGICADTTLSITFNGPPTLANTGKIRIYAITNTTTPVDTIDLSLGSLQSRTIGNVAYNSFPIIITGNVAAIYPHLDLLTTNQTYYVTVDDGAFLDNTGAEFAGITATNAWQFTTKTAGPAAGSSSVQVAADGSGDFCTVQGAVDFLPASNSNHVLVNIHDGTYTEIVCVNAKNNITFRGQDRHQTLITYANNNNINPSTSTRPAFRVAGCSDVAIENLTVSNSTPHGGSQAEALRVGDTSKRFILYNADLDSFQDTLLINTSGDLAYVQDSHIQGDVDYTWGSGTLYVTNCQLMDMSPQSHLCQPRTAQFTNGFAFVNCQIVGANSGVTNCDLGRDAGSSGGVASFPFGQVVYINCAMDTNVIAPAGWILGSGTSQGSETANLRFWEYESVDLSANLVNTNSRVPWSLELDGATATNQVQNVTNWLYGWLPQLAPNITNQPAGETVNAGQTVMLSVGGTGISAPAYQWLKNGTNVPGATSAIFSIADAQVTDGGPYNVVLSNAAGSITSSVATVTVNPPPPPTLVPISNFAINAGVTLAITNSASDSDSPPLTLTFSLPSAPANATIDTNTGVFVWRPLVSQANTTNSITVQVSDNGTPIQSATQSFTVIVNPMTQPILSASSFAGGQFSLSVAGEMGPDYTIQTSTNLLNWINVFKTNSPVTPFGWTDTNARAYPVQFYRVLLGP